MKRTALSVLLLLSLVLMFSCGKESKSPTGPPLEDTYTISGTVTGADSVTVTISGDASATWTVKKSGESYTFTVATGGTYTVTPSKSGYVFTPSDKTIKNLLANLTQNFDAKLASYTLSGTVNGTDSATVTLSGSSSATWMVIKSSGKYTFTVAAFGTYTITPTKKGYVFTPPNTKVENLVANHVQSFDAIPLFTLTGTITGADGVTFTLSGDASDTQTVNSGGAYSFTVHKGGTYTITPSKQWYSLTPLNKKYENLADNHIQDFDAKRDTYTISGTVTGVDGVTVVLSGGASGSQTVNNGGSYSFTVEGGGSYTVTPSKKGYIVNPASQSFTNVKENVTQDFTITPTISGKVTGADGVTVTLSGDVTRSQTVNNGGSYSFTVAYGGNYTVTPSEVGYDFTPPNKMFTNVSASGMQDFTANFNYASLGIVMKTISVGSFSMGQTGIAEPVHTVTLSAFEISATEITQGQYKAVMGTNPSNFTGDDKLPVENVSWNDAVTFCRALSQKTGSEFRLPTEAEWEYACRAGTTMSYNLGDAESDLARAGWYTSNSNGKTHSVGQKTANAWGLYDMHGNVWEWCGDYWYRDYTPGDQTNPSGPSTSDQRVLRGGGWAYQAGLCRSAYRNKNYPGEASGNLGFRIVRRP